MSTRTEARLAPNALYPDQTPQFTPEPRRRWTAEVSLSPSDVYDRNHQRGQSTSVSAAVRYNITPEVSVGVRVGGSRLAANDFASHPARGTEYEASIHVTARYTHGRGRVRPFVEGSVGPNIVTTDICGSGQQWFPNDPQRSSAVVRTHGTTIGLSASVRAGAEIRLTERLNVQVYGEYGQGLSRNSNRIDIQRADGTIEHPRRADGSEIDNGGWPRRYTAGVALAYRF